MNKPLPGFGLHLTLDGYGCSYEQLTNLDLIYQFLDQCPDLIHMTKIMPPYVFKYHGKVPEDWGPGFRGPRRSTGYDCTREASSPS